jgi:predicted dehydrogenase
MKVLQIGLGSMGKRRLRCLKALGYNDIVAFDMRDDRRTEAQNLYSINTINSLQKVDLSAIDAFIISVPPDKHIDYMRIAVEKKIPAFVEASVVIDGLDELDKEARERNVFIAPSCTLRFHPAIKDIKRIVSSGRYGKFTNFTYHAGQYLPDWHPWEKVADYYVSKKETGGGREIVPFELTWLVDIVGYPEKVSGFFGKTMDVGADIDDTYLISLKFKQGMGCLVIDVVARYAIRSLILNMEYGQILWRWDQPAVNLYEANNDRWIMYKQREVSAHSGYNKNIIEEMYIEELGAFFSSVNDGVAFPNKLSDDIDVLKILYKLEGRIA